MITISVVIPYYTRTELLRTALASALAQTLPPLEIIAVDDCSPEDTSWLGTEFPKVRVIRLTKNGGCGHARCQGMLAASGTHVATLDSDDFWYPEKLERQVAFIEKMGDLRGIYSHLQWIDEGNGIGAVRPVSVPREDEPISEYLYVRNGSMQSNSLIIERNLYAELSRFTNGEYLEDAELVIVGNVQKCRIYFLEECLSHWNSTSDPRRLSNARMEHRQRALLNRLDSYFTPKAKAAFEARNLAPCLARNGSFVAALVLLGRGVLHKGIRPAAAVKIILHTSFPRIYSRSAALYNRGLKKRESGSTSENPRALGKITS